jgi:hypothetical protein
MTSPVRPASRVVSLARAAVAGLAALFAASLGACSVPPSNTTVTVEAPSEAAGQWHPVADYLEHRCGDLDCHGDVQRNFIVWGSGGLRLLDAPDSSLTASSLPLAHTTAAEYNATFRSLVGLEPVVMSEVVAGNGQDPEQLTFIRKAEGLEAHKGGTLIVLGTDAGTIQDDCLTSWLAGNTNMSACQQALTVSQ